MFKLSKSDASSQESGMQCPSGATRCRQWRRRKHVRDLKVAQDEF
jgi:hypothetical protein